MSKCRKKNSWFLGDRKGKRTMVEYAYDNYFKTGEGEEERYPAPN